MSDAIASHQTVRLARGRHDSPSHGVCVMELASMLAGERFTDSPRSVCPVVAAFMRTYNDAIAGRVARELSRSGIGSHARALGLADELIAMRETAAAPAPGRAPLSGAGRSRAGAAAR